MGHSSNCYHLLSINKEERHTDESDGESENEYPVLTVTVISLSLSFVHAGIITLWLFQNINKELRGHS